MLTTLIDDFSAANNPVAGWTANPDGAAQPTWQSTGGLLVPNASNAWMVTNQVYGPDMCASWKVTTIPSVPTLIETQLRVQGVGAANPSLYYVFYAGNALYQMGKRVGGVQTVFWSGDPLPSFSNGDRVGAAIIGSRLIAWWQPGSTGQCRRVLEWVDTSITGTGRIGVYTDYSSLQLDDLQGGTIDSSFTLVRRANVT